MSRNPMYLALMLWLVGAAMLLGTVTPAAVVVGFGWLLTHAFIRPEEQAMERTFGDAFREYKRRVRRWI